MTNKFDQSDEKLREQYEEAFFHELMEGYAEYQGEKLRQAAENDAPPSPELIAQMNAKIAKEISRQKRSKAFAGILRLRKYVAIFLIAIVAVFSVSFVSVDAFRSKILNFISINQGTSIEHGLQEPSGGIFAPTYLPDGFYIASYFDNRDPIQVVIQGDNQTDYAIISISADSSKLLSDAENMSESKQVEINGVNGELSEKNEIIVLVWMNSSETLMASMNTNLGQEEAIKIAESINLG